MLNILLYISIGLVLFGYVLYFILILFGRINEVSNVSGFDVAKDIISEYNNINIIESKGYITLYNIKRKVIKLSTKCYYGKDLSSISLSLIEAGVSVVDNNKNKYIIFLRNIFNNLKLLYFFPMISLFISSSSFYVSDAKVSIIFLLIFTFVIYILLEIKGQAFSWISDNLDKIKEIGNDNKEKIIKFINKILWCDKLIYYGHFIMIIRLILIMFEIK